MLALLTEDSQGAAAKKAGIAPRTLRNYLADPEFQAELEQRQRDLIQDATEHLQGSLKDAVKTLRAMLTDSHLDRDRVNAARILLENAIRFTELNDLSRRLEVLENNAREGGLI